MDAERLWTPLFVAFLLLQLCKCQEYGALERTWQGSLLGCRVDGTKCQFSSCGAGKNLVQCPFGFAGGVTGGAAGPIITVTDPSDNPHWPRRGTLRYAVNLAARVPHGGWIVFSKDMEIRLLDYLRVGNNTTIDGRGVRVRLINSAILLGEVQNVILENFEVSDVPNFDTVHIFYGSRLIWVDHLSSSDSKLGLVSVVNGSTDVTISNCHLLNHNYNMLLGASDNDVADRNMRVTVYRNFFEQSMQRMPHCRNLDRVLNVGLEILDLYPSLCNLNVDLRWGYCHVVNNYYRAWTFYCIGGRVYAKVYYESNMFEPSYKLEVTPWYRGFHDDMTPTIESHDDIFLNHATLTWFRHPPISPPTYAKPAYYPPIHPKESIGLLVERCAGALVGRQVVACMASP